MATAPLRRRAFVLGGEITPFIGAKNPAFIWKKHPDFGKKENPKLEDYINKCVNGALNNTGVPASMIQKAWIGNFVGELFSKQGHLGSAMVGAHPDLMNKPVMRVEAACASGGLAFVSALESIQAGTDITMAAGAEVQTTVSARTGADYLARASHYERQRQLDDFVFPALFARRIKACAEEYGLSHADLGALSVKAYANANLNPKAHMHAIKMPLELASAPSDKNPCILGNEELNPFLKLSDCSQVSDGGAALILVSEDGLKQLGKRPEDCIEVLGQGMATGNLYEDSNPLELGTTKHAADLAFAQSGVTAKDLQVGEVHDCFTITEYLMSEALGKSKMGESAQMCRDGYFDINGEFPINTGGGLVGFGHPVGATGIKQVLEIYRQMKGQCDAYQMKSIPSVGVTANMGGDDKTAVVSIFKNL